MDLHNWCEYLNLRSQWIPPVFILDHFEILNELKERLTTASELCESKSSEQILGPCASFYHNQKLGSLWILAHWELETQYSTFLIYVLFTQVHKQYCCLHIVLNPHWWWQCQPWISLGIIFECLNVTAILRLKDPVWFLIISCGEKSCITSFFSLNLQSWIKLETYNFKKWSRRQFALMTNHIDPHGSQIQLEVKITIKK